MKHCVWLLLYCLPCIAQNAQQAALLSEHISTSTTFSLIQADNIGNTTVATTGTAVTIPSTASGNLGFLVATNNSGGADYITAVTGAGTATCPSGANTIQLSNGLNAISGCYVLSTTSGVTSITVTSNATSTYYLVWYEVHKSSGSITLDVQNNASGDTSSTPAGVALTLGGTNDVIFQMIAIFKTVSAVTSPYSSNAIFNGALQGAEAVSLNTSSGAAPTWTATTNSNPAVAAAIAFQ
jgi:hypothetical protein